MPVYEYECEDCGKIVEIVQKISEPPVTECQYCSGRLHKIISQSSFHLKGSGWYVTDYKNRSNQTSASSTPEKKTSAPDTVSASKKDDSSKERSS